MTDTLRAAVQRLADMMTSDLDYHVAHEGEDLEVRTAQGWVSMRGYAASLRYALAEHPADPEPTGDEREALAGHLADRFLATGTLLAPAEKEWTR